MIRIAAFVVTIGLGMAWAAGSARASESAPVTTSHVVATLISDTDAVQPGTPLHLALRLRMKPGWHTYWSNPGDAGAPTQVDLKLPSGSQASGIAWPTPIRLPEGPVMAYGYVDQVVLPIAVTPGSAAGGLVAGRFDVTANATWLVCEKICVPEQGTLDLSLASGTAAASAEAPLFAASDAKRPRPSPFEAHVAPDGTLRLSGAGLSPQTVADAWFLPSEAGLIDQAAPQHVQVGPGLVSLSLTPGSDFKPGASLDGVMVLRDPGGQESDLLIAASPGGAAHAHVPLWQTILLAALAGLILNLMPCVFPILAMKAVSLARLSGKARGTVRVQAAFYTAGVLLAFGALGAVLLTLRAFGGNGGWGFQFQSPVFVAIMAWVLFGVGLNLSGVFEVGAGLAGTGQALAGRHGHAGSFFTGMLAVLVATPCTAPFMGAAVAAALAAPPALTLVIFLAMGVGLAAPYGLLAVFPGVAALLPRPGAWMDVLKAGLAFPMYGAAAWLVWVVSLQAGSDGLLATLAGLVLVGFAAWIVRLAQQSGRRFVLAFAAAAALLAVAVLPTVAVVPSDTGRTVAFATDAEGTQSFTPARLDLLRAAGRPVFVNMTAAWCVTCLVNERVALSPAAVRRAFADRNVAYLKGDWTRADPAITAFLHQHERDGVPLYLLYPPGQAEPTVLPQILTAAEILSELQKLGS